MEKFQVIVNPVLGNPITGTEIAVPPGAYHIKFSAETGTPFVLSRDLAKKISQLIREEFIAAGVEPKSIQEVF